MKDPKRYIFNADAIDRIPYMAPGLVGPEKAAAREAPDRHLVAHDRPDRRAREDRVPDPETSRDHQEDAIASSNPGDLVLDFFAGSGTTGEACHVLGRRFALIDDNPQALEVMSHRFAEVKNIRVDRLARARTAAPEA